MPTIQAGDHIGAVFETADQFTATTAVFAEQGLARGARVMIFPGARTHRTTRLLADDGRLAAAASRGQLIFGDSQVVQLGCGRFDPEYLHQIYAGATRQTVEAGFSGLWVSVDMSWAHPQVAAPSALTTFEAQAFPLFATGRLTAICQYDLGIFSRRQADDACAAHPAGWHGVGFRGVLGEGMHLFGEADLSNRAAFQAVVDGLGPHDHIDLRGMTFLDVTAVVALIRSATEQPGRRFTITTRQQELLITAGMPSTALHVSSG